MTDPMIFQYQLKKRGEKMLSIYITIQNLKHFNNNSSIKKTLPTKNLTKRF